MQGWVLPGDFSEILRWYTRGRWSPISVLSRPDIEWLGVRAASVGCRSVDVKCLSSTRSWYKATTRTLMTTGQLISTNRRTTMYVDGSLTLLVLSHKPCHGWPHFVRTEYAVTGHSHRELSYLTAHNPVCHGCNQSQGIQFRLNEVRWDDMSDVNAP